MLHIPLGIKLRVADCESDGLTNVLWIEITFIGNFVRSTWSHAHARSARAAGHSDMNILTWKIN